MKNTSKVVIAALRRVVGAVAVKKAKSYQLAAAAPNTGQGLAAMRAKLVPDH